MTYHFLYSKISYGDAIHLARAMANTFDTTYFDVYDVCLQESDPRSSKALEQKILVFPNPSNGKFYCELPIDYKGQAIIYDVLGNKIKQILVGNNIEQLIDLPTKSGIYFIRFISIDGQEETHRIIVIN